MYRVTYQYRVDVYNIKEYHKEVWFLCKKYKTLQSCLCVLCIHAV